MEFVKKIKVDTLTDIRKITVKQFGILSYGDRIKILNLSPGIYERLLNGERAMVDSQIKKTNSGIHESSSRRDSVAEEAPYRKIRNS